MKFEIVDAVVVLLAIFMLAAYVRLQADVFLYVAVVLILAEIFVQFAIRKTHEVREKESLP